MHIKYSYILLYFTSLRISSGLSCKATVTFIICCICYKRCRIIDSSGVCDGFWDQETAGCSEGCKDRRSEAGDGLGGGQVWGCPEEAAVTVNSVYIFHKYWLHSIFFTEFGLTLGMSDFNYYLPLSYMTLRASRHHVRSDNMCSIIMTSSNNQTAIELFVEYCCRYRNVQRCLLTMLCWRWHLFAHW